MSTLWPNQWLDQQRLIADPLADGFIEQVVRENGLTAARKIFDHLIREIELPLATLPPMLGEYFKTTNSLPAWCTKGEIEKAQALFLDHGPKFLVFLYFKSLPLLYACANGAEVLVKTGRLSHQEDRFLQFSRRIAETGQFLIHVMTPGALDKGGPGIQSIQKVRLIHAAIRHFLQQGDWDTEKLGKPINQEDLAITFLSFSTAIIDALQEFGIEEAQESQQAYYQVWRAIGSLMGIRDELLPPQLEAGRQLQAHILNRQAGPSEAGYLLTDALLNFSRSHFKLDVLKGGPELLVQTLVKDPISQYLGLHPRMGCLNQMVPKFVGNLLQWGEKQEDRPGVTGFILNAFSRELTLGMVEYFNHYKGQPFQIPPKMKEHWL